MLVFDTTLSKFVERASIHPQASLIERKRKVDCSQDLTTLQHVWYNFMITLIVELKENAANGLDRCQYSFSWANISKDTLFLVNSISVVSNNTQYN